jgi:hypothetical protein
MAWLVYSVPALRKEFEVSVWRNGVGLDSVPAVPFITWLSQMDANGLPNIYSIGFFAIATRGQPPASTTFPKF